MSSETIYNELDQASVQNTEAHKSIGNFSQNEGYGVITPLPKTSQESSLATILIEGTADNYSRSSHLASFKDTFNPPLSKEVSKLLPSVTISTQQSTEELAKRNRGALKESDTTTLSERIAASERMQQLKDKYRTLLVADISTGPAGLNDFDRGLFNGINEWRTSHGLCALEYDSDIRDIAVANNEAMAKRGLGHYYGGPEVAGQGCGTPEATIDAWLNSPGHYAIISDPSLTRMGPAGDADWQTVHFGS